MILKNKHYFIKIILLRVACDKLETLTDEKLWPFPTYGKLLFGIL